MRSEKDEASPGDWLLLSTVPRGGDGYCTARRRQGLGLGLGGLGGATGLKFAGIGSAVVVLLTAKIRGGRKGRLVEEREGGKKRKGKNEGQRGRLDGRWRLAAATGCDALRNKGGKELAVYRVRRKGGEDSGRGREAECGDGDGEARRQRPAVTRPDGVLSAAKSLVVVASEEGWSRVLVLGGGRDAGKRDREEV